MKVQQLIQKLFYPLQNCEATVVQLCKLLGVPVTKTTIQQQLEEHPDYPSLLAISDVLKNIGVDNIAIKTGAEKLYELPLPLIAQLKIEHENLFAVVVKIENNKINFLHPIENKEKDLSKEEFKKIFMGIVLLTETSDSAGENHYSKNIQEEKRTQHIKTLAAAIIPALALIASAICFIKYGSTSFNAIIYTLLTLAGTIVGALLLWYEVDKHNPALKQICSGGKKINCNAILSSSVSKIFGISWSVIGFTYFAGTLISLLVSGIYNLPVLNILAWMNVLALPYIIFSLYYQARIAKQWCKLCLMVQALLAFQFVTSLFGKFLFSVRHAEFISASAIFTIAISFAIPFLVVSLLLSALHSTKENKQNKNELQRLKHNPQIFDALLAKQKAITEPTKGLGITLGNPNAKYKLIKVCNPYCGPCAKAHPVMEDLLQNNPDVQVQIIFTATDDEKDFKAPPVKHLLAIADNNDEQQTKKALDDWYLAEKKDYDVFANKYPMNGELKQQGEKVKAMSDWCNNTEISFTPTFFVNGYQLPEQYSVADLKYFLSV